MDNIQKRVQSFLEEHKMDARQASIKDLLEDFTGDMECGLAGDPKSLLMIPTYITVNDEVPFDEPVLVMDAGGTNFRVALVTIRKDAPPLIVHFNKYPMPGTQGRISKKEFLETVVGYMKPLLDKTEKVGFCFSFPTEILPSKDGKLLGFNKEVKVKDDAGMIVGEALNKTLEAQGLPRKKFVLLNDTVAAMLAGVMPTAGKCYSGHMGLIYGTGTNTCYVEKGSNIKKVPGVKGSMAVNMESGGWAGVPQGDFDKQLDQSTENPGDHIYEKMVSGAYQGDVVLLTLQGAAKEGLFSKEFSAFVGKLKSLETFELDVFCDYPHGDGLLAKAVAGNEEDRLVLYRIIADNFERAARLVTVNVGGILMKTGEGTDPTCPVCVVAEGSAFNKSRMFRERLNYYVKKELNKKRGLYCEFVNVDDATLIGSAIAGLMD